MMYPSCIKKAEPSTGRFSNFVQETQILKKSLRRIHHASKKQYPILVASQSL